MRSLTGQLIGLMLLALLLSQALIYWINDNERDRSLQSLRQDEFIARANAVARLIAVSAEPVHPQVLRASATSLSRYWLSAEPPPTAEKWVEAARRELLLALPARPAEHPDQQEFLLNSRITADDLPTPLPARWVQLPAAGRQQGGRLLELKAWNGIGYATAIAPDRWLNAVYAKPEVIKSPHRYYLSLAVAALVLSLLAVWGARRVGRPLQRLTESAERIGRGETVPPLPEEGADDIRRTAVAFNLMQSRLRVFVEDRTRMIADISHDLRTPVTLLRLQTEFVSDVETRDKMIATLDEMQSMMEATLAFTREESRTEPARIVDMDALVESVCDDLFSLGRDVTFADGERIPWCCRPDSLRRALRNVIENAVRYGERARVRLEISARGLLILIEDDGPGVAEADMERVFSPFVRLENSRNRETGGGGLGLAIARGILRAHGGDISLSNRPSGGLLATLLLPVS
jgi:signal transduction histidine kinase